MKVWLVLVTAVAFGCGSNSSGADPDGGGDGDGGAGDGDGGIAGARTVELTLTNLPTTPMKYSFVVAYQDGANAWQLAPAPTGEVYSFTIHAPSYGVMFACAGSAGSNMGSTTARSVTSAHFAVSERTKVTLEVPARCTDRTADTVMLSGNVTNRPFGGVLVVQYATRSAFVNAQNGNFSMQVPKGTHDLIVSHAVPEGEGNFYVDEVLVVRDVMLNANGSRTLNFSAAQETSFHSVDTSDAPFQARVLATTTLYTANGTTASLVRETFNHESDSLADSQHRASDIYEQAIAVSTLGAAATVSHLTSQPGDQTYVAPAPLGDVETTVPTKTPYVTLESSWPAYDNTIGYLWNAIQSESCVGGAACTTTWSAYLSPGVVGTMPAYRMPDLSGLTGWSDIYELGSAPIVGSVSAMTSTQGAKDFPTAAPADGVDRVTVRSDYAISP